MQITAEMDDKSVEWLNILGSPEIVKDAVQSLLISATKWALEFVRSSADLSNNVFACEYTHNRLQDKIKELVRELRQKKKKEKTICNST